MKAIIVFCVIYYFVSLTIRSWKETKQKRQLLQIRQEQAKRKAEQERILREWQAQREWSKLEAKHLETLEREQLRQRREQERQRKEQQRIAKEQARQAEQLAKHEQQIAKLTFQIEQATEDINNILYKIEELQTYSEYLEDQKSRCVPGSAEYFKWQNKVSSLDDKIYRLNKQKAKAEFTKATAESKLAA